MNTTNKQPEMAAAAPEAPRDESAEQIKERFADGKWHAVETIAKALELDEPHVAETLRTMVALRGTYGCKAERKQHSSKLSYRIYKSDRAIPATELLAKLTPIVAGLRAEGKRSAAAASPAAVAILAGQLQKLIDEWTQ